MAFRVVHDILDVTATGGELGKPAGHDLVENYGVKVDPALHAEVLKRAEHIKTAPYAGFIQPRLVPVTGANGEITDIKVEYPADFLGQMLEYGRSFSFLP